MGKGKDKPKTEVFKIQAWTNCAPEFSGAHILLCKKEKLI